MGNTTSKKEAATMTEDVVKNRTIHISTLEHPVDTIEIDILGHMITLHIEPKQK